MITFENLFTYSPVAYDIVIHVFTFGYAAMAAGLVYFLVTARRSSPSYRLSSVLSAVVMTSAFFELYVLADNWRNSFAFVDGVYTSTDTTFSNGYRYMNWSIDVPVLLTQLLIVLGYTGMRFRSLWAQFVVAGLLMVYTGYVGQFYQVAGGSGPTLPFYIWGTVSTVFFFWVLVLVRRTIFNPPEPLPQRAAGLMRGVWWLLLVSWFLYPGAYLMPYFAFSAEGVVARQITYTVADVTSKVIYGVMLSRVAELRSQEEGYGYALEAAQDPSPDQPARAAD